MAEEAAHRIVRSSTPIRALDNVGEVAAIAVFPDKRRMATTSSDGILTLWDLKRGIILNELEGRGEGMGGIAISQDGKLIASVDCGKRVNAWHGDTGKPLTQAFVPHPKGGVSSMDLSPDGATLATGSSDGTTQLWSTATWQLQEQPISLRHGYGILQSVTCVRYSPSGELLAIATEGSIQIWNPSMKQRIANLAQKAISLVWTLDGTYLLSGASYTIQQWDSSTWMQVNEWNVHTSRPVLAVNCNGTIVASIMEKHVRLWRLSDWRTIAIFQHSNPPGCITFSVDGKRILAGGIDKISEWAVPEHAWPENASKHQAIYEEFAQDCDTEAQCSDMKTPSAATDPHDVTSKILSMDTAVYNACIKGDLPTARELLSKDIDANGDNYRSYAHRSVVLARRLDWDNALDDATRSISIQPSLIGYISLGIAFCGKKKVRDASQAFDLASTFADGDSKAIYSLFLVKAIAFFNANQHADAVRRVRQLAAACPNADIALACQIVEVYLHIQLGNNALDRACAAEAADHFTAAVNTGTFLSKLASDPKYDEFVVLFGCDFTSLWQVANQKRCHALLRAGKLTEVFEAYQYMADMSDDATRASCLNWSISFMKELSTFRNNAPNAEATLDMSLCKYDDENDSISDIDSDSDIDRVSDVLS